MKKEFWRKAPQCEKCVYYCPKGNGRDVLDPKLVWREACRFSGYTFWPELEDAAICFDFKSEGQTSVVKDKAEKDKWVKQHLCNRCAFYGMNGFDLRDMTLIKTVEEWNEQHRCRGYVNRAENDKNGFCSSYLSLEQWAEVEATPIFGGKRIRKWEEFRVLNQRDLKISLDK